MVASLNCSRMDVNMVMLDRLAGRSVAEAHVMDYELILFDADGTLFDYDRAERHALEKACRMHRLEYSERLLERYRKINSALWRQLEEGFITSAEIRVERFRSLLCELGLDAASAPELAQDYLSHLAQGAYLIDGAEEICRYLAPNYRLAILTNGIQEVQTSRFQASPLVPYFDRLILRQPLTDDKPRPEIFEAVGACYKGCKILSVQEEPGTAFDDNIVLDLAHLVPVHLDPRAADGLHHSVSSRIQLRYGPYPPMIGMAIISGRS